MCGIGGIFNTDLPDDELKAALARMERSMLHRGPDEGGTVVLSQPRGGLAARRLSIVDLEHGGQPLGNEDGTAFIVLNGEIYNHQSLRDKLTSGGHRFRGHSDTEASLHLYEDHDVEFLKQLQGMFALAIYDTRKRRLLLARDGPGMKPLYYANTARGLLFASEAGALFATRLIQPSPDPEAIDTYLASGFIPAPASAFRGVAKLRAGQYLIADSTGLRTGEFWKYRYATPSAGEDSPHELEEKLRHAVRSHLAADVPVGVLISGGWDSSLIATFAAAIAGVRLKTFSVVFPDSSDADESRYSRMMARHLGTDHFEVEFRAAMMPDLMAKVSKHTEEPCASAPLGVQYVLAGLVGAHVKTVLSGEGADELFGGYDRFRVSYPYLLRRFVPRAPARLASLCFGPSRLRRGLRVLGAADERTADAEFERMFTPADKRRLLRPEFCAGGPDTQAVLIGSDVLETCPDTLARRLAFDFSGRLADAVLFSGDKMSMANSLEIRMPFLDAAVVEFALRLPSRWKVHGGREKVVLSHLARRYLPREIAARRKKGLGYPHGLWLAPPCKRYARELLLDNARSGPFDAKYLQHALARWMSRGNTAASAVSKLVVLQSWWNEAFHGSGL